MTLSTVGGTLSVAGGTLLGLGPPPVVPVAFGAFSRTAHNTQPLDDTAVSRMSRYRHVAMVDVADVRLRYGHYFQFENPLPTASITIKASVELADGTIHPATFGGATSKTLAPGEAVTADPVRVVIAEGQHFFSRTWVTTPTAGQIPRGAQVDAALGDGVESPGSDKTASGTVALGGNRGFGPVRIDGRSTDDEAAVVISGDSINMETTTYLARAMQAASVPHVSIAQGGDAAYRFKLPAEHARRLAVADGADAVVVAYGANDLGTGVPAGGWTSIATNLAAVWQLFADAGLAVFACTITPRSSSTDAFTTTAGQTPVASNGARVQINDWIRAGAPRIGTTPVEPGTSGAQTMAALRGYYDVADRAETARNSGKWTTNGGAAITADGLHPANTGHQFLSAAVTPAPLADTTPPAAPTALAAEPGNGEAVLTWTDPVGASSIGVYRDGVMVTSVLPGTQTATIADLTNGTAYGFTVDAADHMGNRSAQTAPVSVTPAAPVGPPELVSSATSAQSATGTTIQVAMPAGVQAGDRLVVIIGANAAPTFTVTTPPSGWTFRSVAAGTASSPTAAPQLRCFTKTATGSEGGTTVPFVYNVAVSNGAMSAIAYCLRNVVETPAEIKPVSGVFLSTQAVPTLAAVPAGAIVLTANVYDQGPVAVNNDLSTAQGWVQDAEIQGVGGTNPSLLGVAHLTDADGGTTPGGTWTANAARNACQMTAAFA